jgi:hypothetical protein
MWKQQGNRANYRSSFGPRKQEIESEFRAGKPTTDTLRGVAILSVGINHYLNANTWGDWGGFANAIIFHITFLFWVSKIAQFSENSLVGLMWIAVLLPFFLWFCTHAENLGFAIALRINPYGQKHFGRGYTASDARQSGRQI